MPYFIWEGVDIVGSRKEGKQFAKSTEQLDQRLYARGIALISTRQTTISWFAPAVRSHQVVACFKQLSVLIDAGVLAHQALSLVAQQAHQIRLAELVQTLSDDVHEGKSLSNAIQDRKMIFDPLSRIYIRVGEESGNLAYALHALCQWHESRAEFRKALHAALLVPLITFLFFIAVVIMMFVVILPRFADLFSSYHQELPYMTKLLLSVSASLRSWQVLSIFSALCVGVVVTYWLAMRSAGRNMIERFYLSAPLIAQVITQQFVAHFFQALGLLLDGGFQLVPAVRLIADQTNNSVCKASLRYIEQVLQEGGSLSYALDTDPHGLFNHETVSLVIVGQESGKLGHMCHKIAQIHERQLLERMKLYASLVQPVCMVVLGILVCFLVFAIYGPIFNLANIATF